jgi:hypothetical protein
MAQRNAKPRFEVGPGGWVRYTSPDLRDPVYVRLGADPLDGRLEVVELHLGDGRHRFDAADLRKVPITRIVALANHPEAKPSLLARIDVEEETWTPPAFDTPARAQLLDRVKYVPAPITVPDARPYPPEFYKEIADRYMALVSETNRPAVVIALAADVPVSTSRAWIKRAREQGYLPAGRKGARG